MGITRFGDHERASLGDAAERSQSGYLQSRYPLLSCNHSLKDITEDNFGYCFGVTSDQIPFEAELWYDHNPETKNVTIYMPEIVEFNEIEGGPLINATTGTRAFNYDVQRHYSMALCDGMVDNGSIESLCLLNTYIELLIDYGMIEYSSNVYNASASRLVDFAGNDIVSISITLEEAGEVMASTSLIFTPFIERINRPKLHVIEQIPEIFAYFAENVDVGNADGILLYKLLYRKKMGYDLFHELCSVIASVLDSATWTEISNVDEMERIIELVVEQAVSLMPLDITDYDMINRFDKWQEEFCDEDNDRIDDAVNTIFCNEECRRVIEEEARNGRYLELAKDIGIEIH